MTADSRRSASCLDHVTKRVVSSLCFWKRTDDGQSLYHRIIPLHKYVMNWLQECWPHSAAYSSRAQKNRYFCIHQFVTSFMVLCIMIWMFYIDQNSWNYKVSHTQIGFDIMLMICIVKWKLHCNNSLNNQRVQPIKPAQLAFRHSHTYLQS